MEEEWTSFALSVISVSSVARSQGAQLHLRRKREHFGRSLRNGGKSERRNNLDKS